MFNINNSQNKSDKRSEHIPLLKFLNQRAFDAKKRLVLKLSVSPFQPVGKVKSVAIKYAFRSWLRSAGQCRL